MRKKMPNSQKTSQKLLAWYQEYGRDLPWRVKGGAHPNPYVILVSEFMLQQTTVKTVIPYFKRFMERFPTIETLAKATEEEVYAMWQGLGYYTRARSLHTTAQIIVNEYAGKFPQNKAEVMKLKGIGAYTVASFLALAYNQPETVIDGNVMRIICRLYHITRPLDEVKEVIQEKAEQLTDKEYAADYASAIMDLGAMICTPKKPQCLICPLQEECQSKDKKDLEQIPIRRKMSKKEKEGSVYLIQNDQGNYLLRKRTEPGLLTRLYEFPWQDEGKIWEEAEDTGKAVTHIFTHIKLTLRIYKIKSNKPLIANSFFVSKEALTEYPLSTLMKKVINKA